MEAEFNDLGMKFLANGLRSAFCTGAKLVDKMRAKHSMFEFLLRVFFCCCGGGMVIGDSDWDDGNLIISNNLSRIMRSFFRYFAKVELRSALL